MTEIFDGVFVNLYQLVFCLLMIFGVYFLIQIFKGKGDE